MNPTLCRESADGSLPRRVSASYTAGCSKPRPSSAVLPGTSLPLNRGSPQPAVVIRVLIF
ncbi:unnamed protein product [Brassica oleracea]